MKIFLFLVIVLIESVKAIGGTSVEKIEPTVALRYVVLLAPRSLNKDFAGVAYDYAQGISYLGSKHTLNGDFASFQIRGRWRNEIQSSISTFYRYVKTLRGAISIVRSPIVGFFPNDIHFSKKIFLQNFHLQGEVEFKPKVSSEEIFNFLLNLARHGAVIGNSGYINLETPKHSLMFGLRESEGIAIKKLIMESSLVKSAVYPRLPVAIPQKTNIYRVNIVTQSRDSIVSELKKNGVRVFDQIGDSLFVAFNGTGFHLKKFVASIMEVNGVLKVSSFTGSTNLALTPLIEPTSDDEISHPSQDCNRLFN